MLLEKISEQDQLTVCFSDRVERRLRRITGWILVGSLLAGELGAPWDGIWHGAVGRDWFWTPPHILIYSAVAS